MAPKRIYVFGGSIGFGIGSNQTHSYDPISNSWLSEAPMPVARYGAEVAVVNDVFYVIGGGGFDMNDVYGTTALATNEQYTPVGYGTPDPSYVIETTPPKINILSPLNQTYNETSVPLVFTVDKTVNWTGYSLDGEQNVTVTGNSTLTNSMVANVTVANVTSGLHNITVYANDTFGNIGASENITFQVKLLELSTPSPTATVAAASGVSAVVVVAGLLVYFKKRKH